MRKLSLLAALLLVAACSSGGLGDLRSIFGTRVVYQGNSGYTPADLERGDQITVSGYNNNSRFVADRITVTRNVRSQRE